MIKRNRDNLYRLKNIFSMRSVSISHGLKKVTAFAVVLFQLLGALIFDLPASPQGSELDMNKFTLVWADEFNSGSLDFKYWGGHYVWGLNGGYQRDTAYWSREQLSFDDENLIITAEHRDDGPIGEGYYSYGLDTSPNHTYFDYSTGYEQLYGYFEIRCILPKGAGLNPAFWMLCEGMFDTGEGLTDGGVTGCEIDVFETKTNPKKEPLWKNSVYHTIHVDSYDEYHRSEMQGHFYADDPYEKYNTYGVEWNENEYIFYINGVETARTDFGGVCRVPLYLIISLGVDKNVADNDNLPSRFIVDYVKAYQYNSLLQ